VLHPIDWTTGWDNESSTAYAIKKDHVVVYDDHKAMIAKVFFQYFFYRFRNKFLTEIIGKSNFLPDVFSYTYKFKLMYIY